MRVGEIVIRPVLEIDEIAMPPQVFVSDITAADIDAHLHWLIPQFYDAQAGNCRLSHHAWLIEANGKRIMVDPCIGHRRHRPSLPFFHMIDSPFLQNLAALGVTPEEIDYVFCTHLHLDHCGWNTRLLDGRYVPTFPNARYLFSPTENAFWRRDIAELGMDGAGNEGVYAECVQPVIEAGLADMAHAGETIAGCLTLMEAAGHTIGHMAGVLESRNEGAVLAGDAIHHPLQVAFVDREMYGYDPVRARQTRHAILDLCAARDYWLAPAHFRAPFMCKIRKSEGGYGMIWDTQELEQR
jgi:glyoxylase-like metal-dependent hydrolase (beta-lactamase superfamily II)